MAIIRSCTWDEIDLFSKNVYDQIVIDGFEPTVIIGILRGGVIPSVILSHLFGSVTVYGITIRTTMSECARAKRELVLAPNTCHLPDLTDHSILLVDDVTNTGNTLNIGKMALEQAGATRISTACLIWDTVSDDPSGKISACTADFYATEWHAWVAFPWE